MNGMFKLLYKSAGVYATTLTRNQIVYRAVKNEIHNFICGNTNYVLK